MSAFTDPSLVLFREITHAAAQALYNERCAPYTLPPGDFAIAALPPGAALPDWSDDEWDAVLTFADGREVVMLYCRFEKTVQLDLF